jgi:hypothetical protein
VRDTQVKANPPARDPQLNPNTASRESLVKPNVADSPNATLVAFARRCIEALRAKDGPWLTEHYGTTETIADKDNLGRLSAMIRKKGYTAEVLTAPHSAEGAAEFKMEFAYSGAFGPTLKTTADFLVNPGESAAVPNAVRCRVKGTLRTP